MIVVMFLTYLIVEKVKFMALPSARALRSYAHKALGAWPVSASIANAGIFHNHVIL